MSRPLFCCCAMAPVGNDRLEGTGWVDYLFGGADDDVLMGGHSNDVLTGGTGADRFLYAAGDGHDTITDFAASEGDRLVFNADAFDVGTTLADIAASTYMHHSGRLRIDVDTGGSISLEGVTSLSVAELEWMV